LATTQRNASDHQGFAHRAFRKAQALLSQSIDLLEASFGFFLDDGIDDLAI
jgi:hypothetical protein